MKRSYAITALLLGLAQPVSAHRGHESLSVVQIDVRSGAVTVTHHLTAHDTEPALSEIAPEAQASLDDPEALKALTAYVTSRFILEEPAGAVRLQCKDAVLAGDTVQLIYAGNLRTPTAPLRIHSRLFTDLYPDQHNQVNVRRTGVTQTLNFFGGTEAQTLPGE